MSGLGRRGIVVLLATLAGVALTLRLGFWQLDRSAQKVAIQTQIDARGGLAPLASADLAGSAAAAAAQFHRRAVLQGRWVAGHTVFLDNRQMDGAPGFYVVTPLRLEGRAEAVAVQRGWVPRDPRDRIALPSVATPSGPVEIAGVIAPPPSRLFDLGAEAVGAIRQNLDLAAYAGEAGVALLPLSVQQTDSTATAVDGLKRRWPAPQLDVSKHYGYAFQWFALAALMAGLYVWYQIIRPNRRAD